MKALMRRRGCVGVYETDMPARRIDEVVVRIFVAGLCRTDIYVARGQLSDKDSIILGHEFVGEVMESPPNSSFRSGDLVTANPVTRCEQCKGCASGTACFNPGFLGVTRDGIFAEYAAIPMPMLIAVPPRLSLKRAAYTEPVAAAMAVLNADLPKTGRAIILGANRIATLTSRILRHHGFTNFALMSHDELSNFRDGADCVIETEASKQSYGAMLTALRPGGLAVLKSRPAAPIELDTNLAVRKSLRIQAVSYAPFEAAVNILLDPSFYVDDLFGTTYSLDKYDEAVSLSDGCGTAKSFFSIGEASIMAA